MPKGKCRKTDKANVANKVNFETLREEEFYAEEFEAAREIKREASVKARQKRDSVRTNRRSCICNDDRCLEITGKYCIINDVRGTYMRVSSMTRNGGSSGGIFSDDDEEDLHVNCTKEVSSGDESPESPDTPETPDSDDPILQLEKRELVSNLNKQRLERFSFHLGIDPNVLETLKDLRISAIHFNPMFQTIRCDDSASFIDSKVFRSTAQRIGFLDEDRIPGTDYFILVPNYSLNAAEVDADLAFSTYYDSISIPSRSHSMEIRNQSIVTKLRSSCHESTEFNGVTSESEHLLSDLRDEIKFLNEQVASADEEIDRLQKEQLNGLTRQSMNSDEYHLLHPNCASLLFGAFGGWQSLRVLLSCFFDGVDCTAENNTGKHQLTVFEFLLMGLLRLHAGLDESVIAMIFDIDRSYAGKIISFIVPYFGEVGQDLAKTNFVESIEETMKPIEFQKSELMKDVSWQCDGKDWPIDSNRKDAGLNSLSYSAKIDSPACRCNVHTTLTGMIMEFTAPALGSATEQRHVIEAGRVYRLSPAASDSRNILSMLPQLNDLSRPPRSEKTAGRVVSENERRMSQINKLMESCTVRVPRPPVESTGRQAYDRQMEELMDSDDETAISAADSSENSNKFVDEMFLGVAKLLVDRNLEISKEVGSDGRDKKNPRRQHNDFTLDDIEKDNNLRAMGPNNSAERKIRQLERLQRIHDAAENQLIPPSMITYHLKKYNELRSKLLEGLRTGGDDQFRTETGLSKLHGAGLVDRGYKGFGIFYPNLNAHIYPSYLEGRKHFSYNDMKRDVTVKKLRYTSEVIFSRVQTTRFLHGTITHNKMPLMDYAVSWAFGRANMFAPLRKPHDWDDYVEKRGVAVAI